MYFRLKQKGLYSQGYCIRINHLKVLKTLKTDLSKTKFNLSKSKRDELADYFIANLQCRQSYHLYQ